MSFIPFFIPFILILMKYYALCFIVKLQREKINPMQIKTKGVKKMKKTSLIILAAVLVFVLAACSKSASDSVKKDEPKESVTQTTAQLEEEKTTETTQLTEAQKEQEKEKKTEKTTEAKTEKSGEKTTEEAEKTTRPSTTNPPKKKTAAEIAELYNSAVNKAVSSTAGFKKVIDNSDIDAGLPSILDKYKNDIFGFMRVGTSEENQSKGQKIERGGLRTASLTAADIKSFDYSEKDGKIILKISLKDGTTNSGSVAKAPVDKTGIFTGNKDWKEIDHKTADNYKYAIDNVKLGSIKVASVGSVTEKTKNAVVTAVINTSTKKPESITVSFDSTAHLSNLKAMNISLGNLDAGISSKIEYKDFKW